MIHLQGRKKIYEGENVGVVLQEEIEELAEKLEEIQRSYGVGDYEVQKCSNFDKKTAILQRKLENLGGLSDEKCTQQTSEMAETSMLSSNTSHGIDKETIALAHENNLNCSEVSFMYISFYTNVDACHKCLREARTFNIFSTEAFTMLHR